MITFKKHSGIYTLEATQWLPINLDTAWPFFSTPKNLARITPDHMGFQITSGDVADMHVGQIITYSVGILPGIRANWVTEITHVDTGRFFVDEQRFGPYAMWHHEHWFEEKDGGTAMLDRVSYRLPLAPLGNLAHPFIEKQLRGIFEYREKTLETIFPAPADQADGQSA
jgi:ligand-binding SRPBCC domain-containing protein